MAIGRVAKKLYAQQGEFGTLRKAYKEAFRRQAISNYAPANIVGRMFGFGSIFHTMAKKAFGTPEWDPRALETGRPNVSAGRGGGSFRPSSTMSNRLSDALLGDIAENTDRTASALEDMENIQKRMEKKLDISENTKREEDFESALKKLRPLPEEKLTKGGPTSPTSPRNKSIFDLLGLGTAAAVGAGAGAAVGAGAGAAVGAGAGAAAAGRASLLARIPIAATVVGILNGILGAAEEYQKSGEMTNTLQAFYNKLTFGLFEKRGLKDKSLEGSLWIEGLGAGLAGGEAASYMSLQRERERTNANLPPPASPKPNSSIPWWKVPFTSTDKTKRAGSSDWSGSSPENPFSSTNAKVAPAATRPAKPTLSVAPAATQKTNLTGIEGNLLNAIASAEASASGYDGVFGSRERSPEFAQLTSGRRLTELTVSEVMALQPRLVRLNAQKGGNKNEGGAVGRYQIVTNTLKGLVKEMGLTGNEMFSPELQDRMAITLMNRRGLQQFKAGKISAAEFQNNLSKEWAGLPNVTGRSSYEGVGTNKATMSSAALQAAITGTGKLNVPAATTAARSTQVAAASAASATNFQATMSAPESMGTTIVNNMPPVAFGTSPQMSESVDEFVTRVMVAMGVVTQT